jgi:hypothetical protein
MRRRGRRSPLALDMTRAGGSAFRRQRPGHSEHTQRQSVGGGAHRSSASGPNRTSCAIRTLRLAVRASAHCHAAGAAVCPCFGLRGRAVAPWRDGRELEVRLFGTVGTTVERRGAHSGGIERFCDVFTFGSLSRQCRAWITKCVTPAHGAARCGCMRRPNATARPSAVRTRGHPARLMPHAVPPCTGERTYDSIMRQRATRQRRTGQRGSAAQDNASAPHGATRQRRTGQRG